MESSTPSWLKVLNPETMDALGSIRHVLFDFDGTVSVLRQGWEKVMTEVMLASICGDCPAPVEIEQEVHAYIDESAGILTIRQMEWLAGAVARHGLVGERLTAAQYKVYYLSQLMVQVRERISSVAQGQVTPEAMMMRGAGQLIAGLWERGVTLYVASGTDHPDVANEVRLLGLERYFNGRVYGALEVAETNDKEKVIQRILDEHKLAGNELLVVGDGPVEIREARRRKALALGVASDEVRREGWNPRKVERLVNAGADLLVGDFSNSQELLAFLFPG